jgi:hypothetical protein
VLSLIRRGRLEASRGGHRDEGVGSRESAALEELADIPEIADAIAAIDDLETRGNRRERDDEPGRDWVAPESRRRFDRRRDEPADDGTVSSRDWRPPPRAARPDARVWRPRDPEAEDTPWESVRDPAERPAKSDAKPAKKPAKRVEPAKPRGGITFPAADDDAVGDEDDLAGYMHPDDVPPKK